MAKGKYLAAGIAILFGVIACIGYAKKGKVREISSEPLVEGIPLASERTPETGTLVAEAPALSFSPPSLQNAPLPEANRIFRLFALDASKLPFVETVSYTSRVPWLQGRPAWIADYASYYETSRHFIARSLNKKPDYFTQRVGPGDKFNVFRKDKRIQFHLLIDLSLARMWFYAMDLDAGERFLLKTYPVGLGRKDETRLSGNLTPVGKYLLGDKIAIYKPGTMGFFQDKKVEMIQIFGTRWIPFSKELEGCSEPAKGLGLHGAPWVRDSVSGHFVEEWGKVGRYESDGCIRLLSEDMEEIFAIIITKPTVVEIVPNFSSTKLPGVEKEGD